MEKATVLIVEDEAAMQNALKNTFESSGFDAIAADNGDDGLQMALEKHPDLILLDILMPKLGGMDMLKKLRADLWGVNCPVIILSNLEPDEDMINGINDNEPCYYLIKANSKIADVIVKAKIALSMAP